MKSAVRPFISWRKLAVLSLGIFSTALYGEEASSPSQDTAALFSQFNEITQKVRANPEIKELEAKVEEAQKVYTRAYEEAIEKEAPELLDKIRRLQRDKLQALRKRALQFPQEFPDDLKLSPDERARLQKVRSLAFKEADVIHEQVKVTSAANSTDRDKAEMEYKKVMLETMKRIDPGIEEILKKIKADTSSASSAKIN